jgi:hypothetical protein
MIKIHLFVSKENAFGGYNCGTLCGRESDAIGVFESNSTDNKAEVTCKVCHKIMNDPKHWRHRKYLSDDVERVKKRADLL